MEDSSQSKGIFVKLTKIRDSESAYVKNHIEAGFEITGYIKEKPVVGEVIFILDERGYSIFTSSIILNVLPNNRWQTNNSIYEMICIEEFRDNQIDAIING
jgi:hypothetical protein